MEDVTTENTKSKSTNIKATTSSIDRENLDANHSNEDDQLKSTSDARKDNHEDNADVNNLIDRIDNCNVTSKNCITENTVGEKNCDTDNTKDSPDTSTGESFARKKITSFTFNVKKYENLSQDADYELPRLKILGRVDTEFKFTSTFSA